MKLMRRKPPQVSLAEAQAEFAANPPCDCHLKPKPEKCVAFRLPGERWHRSFINEVYPNIDDAVAALPEWLTATGKYMGVDLDVGGRRVHYPTRGESFEYDVVPTADAMCMDWHHPFIEDEQRIIHQPLTPAEIAAGAKWQS